MNALPRISVIIPVLNEEDAIISCLRQFDLNDDMAEVIVSDGGSRDRTVEQAQAFSGIRVIHSSSCGRAMQMNAGAAEATGDIFLFLHADTILPANWLELVHRSTRREDVVGGRFRLRIADPSLVYRCVAWWSSNFRSRLLGITYGDQAIYVRRAIFERVGGYPPIPIFEDSEFCTLLKREGAFDWIDTPVLTSARRWQRRGVVRTVLLTFILRFLYMLSVSPRTLSRYYGAVR